MTPNDREPGPTTTSWLAVTALVVGVLGVVAYVVLANLDSVTRREWIGPLIFFGGAAPVLAVAAFIEIVVRWRTHRGLVHALLGGLAGFFTMAAAFMAGFEGAFHGRPLRLRGRVAVAPTTAGDDWAEGPTPEVAGLSPALRERLGAQWLQDAREEHASVPAFSLLALQLTGLGAPPELIVAAHRAAIDEVRHARRCFALAAAYLGRPCAPAAWPGLAGGSHGVELETLACEALADGCVGEGAAAEVAGVAAARAQDPAVRAVLADIARDEGEHAALAWEVLRWALARGGEPVACAVVARARALEVRGVGVAGDEALAVHGRLSASESAEIRGRVVAATRGRLAGLLSAARAA